MALNLRHQTRAEFLTRFRRRYRNAEREEAARMAHWLHSRIQDGDLTQAQVRNAFELDTSEKWLAFRNRVMVLSEHHVAIQAARGE